MTTTNDKLIRWQKVTIDQLGFSSNLILTVNIAVIGFLINKIVDNKLLIQEGKTIFTIGLILLILSFILGIALNLTRLYDFRLTTKITKIKSENINDSRLEDIRCITKCLGKITWTSFIMQVIIFTLGMILLLVSFLIMFSEKLF